MGVRDITFRGKRTDNGEWVYGDLVHSWEKMNTKPDIQIYNNMGYFDVDPATVGQFTGLVDKNDVKIFEGDIISYNKSAEVVRFDTSLGIPCFITGIGWGSSTAKHPYKISKRHVVIGNIHDHPSLLQG